MLASTRHARNHAWKDHHAGSVSRIVLVKGLGVQRGVVIFSGISGIESLIDAKIVEARNRLQN
jgi:hypothetical protein